VKNVGQESIIWTCNLIDHLTENTVKRVRENVADTEVSRWKQKIIRGIRNIAKNTSYHGATLRDIQRGPAQGIQVKELRQYLESLAVSEEIGVGEYEAENGRKVRFYYLTERKQSVI